MDGFVSAPSELWHRIRATPVLPPFNVYGVSAVERPRVGVPTFTIPVWARVTPPHQDPVRDWLV